MSVWTYTTNSQFNRMDERANLSFLTRKQRERLERIRQARMLYEGHHRRYFLDEGRTQFTFNTSIAGKYNGAACQEYMYIPLNMLRLISYKSADLIFGAEPIIRVEDELSEKKIKAFAERSNLHDRLSDSAVCASWSGEAFIELCIWRNQVYAITIPPDEIVPEGELQPDGQYPSYVRYQRDTMPGVDTKPITIQLETRYLPGMVQRRLYTVESDGKRTSINLNLWPAYQGKAPSENQQTGIEDNTIVFVANQIERSNPVSDYDGLIHVQDELNSKQTQLARVLMKHADPKLFLTAEFADDDGNVPISGEVFFGRSKDDIPSYITWNAELANAIEDRKFTLNSMLMLAEMSQVLIGLKDGAAPDAARKLRLEATNSLAKAARKAAQWKPAVKRICTLSQMMEGLLPGQRSTVVPVGVEIRDGLPIDELDEANIISTYRACGAMSQERTIERQLIDPAAVKKELRLLADEAKQQTPSVLLNDPQPTPPDPAQQGQVPQ